MKVAPEMALKFLLFDHFNAMFTSHDGKLGVGSRILSGGLAGMTCHLASYPFDGS